ncbi:MAG TPA: DUF2730 family protein [Xanthobacteraceae bacterium]|nr:DUF2730 family protein [Xanthobacteraceae bacterium]
MDEIRAWAPILIAAASLLYAIVSARGRVASARVDKLEEELKGKAEASTVGLIAGKVDIAEDRIARVEGELAHLPSREQTHGLELALSKMEGRLGQMAEQLKPIAATNERLQEWLYDEARAQSRGAA